MAKYKNGDLIGHFEGCYYIYGIDQPFLQVAENVDAGGLEDVTPQAFLEQYEIDESGYFKYGFPSNDLKEMCKSELYPSQKGIHGAFPLTIWESK